MTCYVYIIAVDVLNRLERYAGLEPLMGNIFLGGAPVEPMGAVK